MTLPTSTPTSAPTALRIGSTSWRWRARPLAVCALGLVALLVVSAANMGRGDFPVPVGDVLAVLVGAGEGAQTFIVLELRLPRTLTGLLVGAALGLAGAITQAVTRNALASPDILGVTDGAGLLAVMVLVIGGGAGATGLLVALGIPLAALLGGIGAAVLVYVLAWRGGLDPFRLVLVGIGVSLAAAAGSTWLLAVANVAQAGQVLVWLRGSLNARGFEHVAPVAVALLVVVPVVVWLAFRLSAMELGDDTATGLGVRVDRVRGGLVAAAVVLAAVATAAAGPIRFVALVSPQIALRLSGGSRPPLAGGAILGALIVVTGDLLARTVLGGEVPVGVVTVVLGAPYLLYLLVARTRKASV